VAGHEIALGFGTGEIWSVRVAIQIWWLPEETVMVANGGW